MAPTPLIPNGVYKIRNGQFTKRVADPLYGEQYGHIVGAIKRPSNLHDQWRITNFGDGGNQVTIRNASTGTPAYADEHQGAPLIGSDVDILWTIVKVDGGRYAIQSPDASFVWVLPEGNRQVEILLVHQTGQDNTKWYFDRLYN